MAGREETAQFDRNATRVAYVPYNDVNEAVAVGIRQSPATCKFLRHGLGGSGARACRAQGRGEFQEIAVSLGKSDTQQDEATLSRRFFGSFVIAAELVRDGGMLRQPWGRSAFAHERGH